MFELLIRGVPLYPAVTVAVKVKFSPAFALGVPVDPALVRLDVIVIVVGLMANLSVEQSVMEGADVVSVIRHLTDGYALLEDMGGLAKVPESIAVNVKVCEIAGISAEYCEHKPLPVLALTSSTVTV